MKDGEMQLLRDVLEAAGDGLMDWDFRSGGISYSDRWKAILGHEPTQLEDSPALWLELSHPDDRAEVDRKLIEHMDALWPFVHTWRLRHCDGSWRWLLARAVTLRNDQGLIERLLLVFSDISDRVFAERRLAGLVSAIPDFILRVTVDGTIVDARLPLGVTNMGEEPPRGVNLAEWAPSKDFAPTLLESVCRVAASGRSESLELRCLDATRTEYEAHVASSSDGEAVCVLRDVTARRQFEAQVQQSQRLESIGQLAAGIAHEINTPIQFVSDSLHFLRESVQAMRTVLAEYRKVVDVAGDPAELGEFIEHVRQTEEEQDLAFIEENVGPSAERAADGLERVTTIVRSMKEFAHPGQDSKSPVDLNRAITTTVTIARSEYKYVADVEMELGEIPTVPCFAGEINQAVLNIVVNAAHAIGDVVKDSGERGRITIKTFRDDKHVAISISDTGRGIPEAIQHRIFDPFFTTKEVGKGTGQGLSLARATIVQKHQGTLTFETSKDKGTTFLIRLPIGE